MDGPLVDRPGDGGMAAEPNEDLAADLLRLTAAIVTLVAAIARGIVR